MIPRKITSLIKENIQDGFVTIIYGPRRVGKTVLLEHLIQDYKQKGNQIVWFNGDTQETRDALSSTSEVALSNLLKDKDVIVIDEAQRIEHIGLSLKILIDKFPKKRFFVTGSSSFMLAKGIQESLTGRNNTYKLYPLSTHELGHELESFQKPSLLSNQLILGGYPYLQQLPEATKKQKYLESLVQDYLYRDILSLSNTTSEDILRKLVTLLAFQIGSQVSLNELAQSLSIDVKTVSRYINILKQGFVIFELSSFSTNLRKEIAKSKKYYFWDTGIRNAIISQFSPIELRSDAGQLWENFLAVERKKKHEYSDISRSYYFWRTYEQAEIDWIELEGQNIESFEFKWNYKKSRTPKAFKEAYNQEATFISKHNYLDFVG